jgi:hypothetical protein
MVALVAASCATDMSSPARSAAGSAARDWSCPRDRVLVDDLGSNRFRVSGCGKSDTFVCSYVTFESNKEDVSGWGCNAASTSIANKIQRNDEAIERARANVDASP